MNFLFGPSRAGAAIFIALAVLICSNSRDAEAQFFAPSTPDRGETYRIVLSNLGEAGNELTVIVQDASSGEPIPGAEVLVGDRAGIPFAANLRSTDNDGMVTFSAPELQAGTWNVSARKEKYQGVQVVMTNARVMAIQLQPIPQDSDSVFLRGRLEPWPTGIGRSDLEAGLFVPAFRASTMLNFDLSQVVSNHKVDIAVLPGVNPSIPGNFVMPPQDKNYNFFRVHLEKPEFAMPLASYSQSYMTGIIGSVPLTQAVSRIRAKDFLGAVNLMRFSHVDWTDWMPVDSDANLTLNVTRPLSANSVTSKHPTAPNQFDLVAFHLIDPKGDGRALIPLDIKARGKATSKLALDAMGLPVEISPEELKAATTSELKLADLRDDVPGSEHYVFSAYLDQAQFSARPLNNVKFSAALSPALMSASGRLAETSQYLGLVEQKGHSSDRRTFNFQLDTSSGLHPEFIILNVFSVVSNLETGAEIRKLLWTSFLPPEAREVRLPEIAGTNFLPARSGGPALPAGVIRREGTVEERLYWQVLAIRRDLAPTTGVWDSITTVKNLRHISHATKVF